MADVSRPDDRGQLFIVGALALAVLLVTLAMLLNTAIYTGNLATREPGPGTGEPIEYETTARAAGGGLLTAVNHANNGSYTYLESNFTAAVDAWSESANVHRAIVGVDAHTQVGTTTRGTRIVQDTTGNFTNKSNAANWHLAKNARVRSFTMTVQRSSLDSIGASLLENTFRLNATGDGGQSYLVYIYSETRVDGTYVVVKVKRPDGTTSECAVEQAEVTVDVTAATVAGNPCAPLTFFDDLQAPYALQYENSKSVEGQYSMVVTRQHGDLLATGHYYDTAANGDPYIVHALYAADLQVTYRSPVAYYQTQVRVAPGEPDA